MNLEPHIFINVLLHPKEIVCLWQRQNGDLIFRSEIKLGEDCFLIQETTHYPFTMTCFSQVKLIDFLGREYCVIEALSPHGNLLKLTVPAKALVSYRYKNDAELAISMLFPIT